MRLSPRTAASLRSCRCLCGNVLTWHAAFGGMEQICENKMVLAQDITCMHAREHVVRVSADNKGVIRRAELRAKVLPTHVVTQAS